MAISTKSIVSIVMLLVLLHMGSNWLHRFAVIRSLSDIENKINGLSEQIQKLQDKIEENDIKNQPKTIKPYTP